MLFRSAKGDKVMDKVVIFDTTMRDGEQAPGATMNKEDKLKMARQLDRLGADVIEAGFAANSPAWSAMAWSTPRALACRPVKATPDSAALASKRVSSARAWQRVADDTSRAMSRVAEYVDGYYSRAQSILAVETVVVQQVTRDLTGDEIGRAHV